MSGHTHIHTYTQDNYSNNNNNNNNGSDPEGICTLLSVTLAAHARRGLMTCMQSFKVTQIATNISKNYRYIYTSTTDYPFRHSLRRDFVLTLMSSPPWLME